MVKNETIMVLFMHTEIVFSMNMGTFVYHSEYFVFVIMRNKCQRNFHPSKPDTLLFVVSVYRTVCFSVLCSEEN